MTNKKNTKKALLSSVLSLVLCMSMLVGTTFAWFTDSVTSSNNIIKSGNLDVELEYSVDLNEWNQVTDTTNVFKENALWEPGYTEVVYLRVSNKGSLALKYNLGVNIVSEKEGTNKDGKTFRLSDYIHFGVKEDVTDKYVDRVTAIQDVQTSAAVLNQGYIKNGSINAGAQAKVFAMVVYMPETIGNEANHNGNQPEIQLGINLLATQYTYESDSFDNMYDEEAIYADAYATNATELAEALAEGGSVALMGDMAVSEIVIPKGVSSTIILNGKDINGTSSNDSGNQVSFKVKGDLTITGTGTVTHVHTGANMGWGNLTAAFSVEGGTLTLGEGVSVVNNGGTNMAYAVDVNSTLGETILNINGATLYSAYTGVRLFNNHKTEKAIVNLNSGFVEGESRDIWAQNPSATAVDENAVVNIAETYNYTKTIQTTSNNSRIYQFTDYVVANNDDGLDEAIKNGATTLVLSSGNYVIPDSAQGKELSIIGNGNTVVATQDDGSYEGCDYSLDGATVTFEGVVINTDSSTYTGYARLKATYKNCTINGTYTLYDNSVFEDCTFNVSGNYYNIWTWGAPIATFKRCTFNTSGKAILLYGGTDTVLTVDNCVFNDDNAYANVKNKAAIEVGSDWTTDHKTLIVNKTVVNGFDVTTDGANTGTTLWGNKNSIPQERLNVVVDGVDVY